MSAVKGLHSGSGGTGISGEDDPGHRTVSGGWGADIVVRAFAVSLMEQHGTPDRVVRRLKATIREAGARKSVTLPLASSGYDVVLSTREEFAALIRSDVKKWTDLIRSAGIKAE